MAAPGGADIEDGEGPAAASAQSAGAEIPARVSAAVAVATAITSPPFSADAVHRPVTSSLAPSAIAEGSPAVPPGRSAKRWFEPSATSHQPAASRATVPE